MSQLGFSEPSSPIVVRGTRLAQGALSAVPGEGSDGAGMADG